MFVHSIIGAIIMANSKERFAEMRLKSRQNLMEAALRLFSTNGYHATSISAIAKEAGVAVGLMYNYFNSKEELLDSIIEDFFQNLMIAVSAEFQKSAESQDVRKILDTIIKAVQERHESWRLLAGIMFQPNVSLNGSQKIQNFFLHQQGLFESYFQHSGAEHPQENAKILNSVLHGAFILYAVTGNIHDLLLIRQTVVENLLENRSL
jgi:AcrR family transcriptional regulator